MPSGRMLRECLRRFLINIDPKPKKERMKKAMKFMKRTWRFWTPGKADVRVHNDLIKLLDERKLRYSVFSHNKNLEVGFDFCFCRVGGKKQCELVFYFNT